MELLFLGTSAGVPTRGRNVSATALLPANRKGWCLVDCGEGTQHQVLRTPLSLHDLDAVFITHVHGDHCFGLPGLFSSAGMSGRTRPLKLVAPAALEPWLAMTLEVSHSTLPFEVEFQAVESFGGVAVAEWSVTTLALSHRVPCWAYVFTEAKPEPRLDVQRLAAEGIPRGALWGQLAQGQTVVWQGRLLQGNDYRLAGRMAQRVVICGDNDTPALLREACGQAQVLVHEATYTQSVLEAGKQGYGHSSAQAVARMAEQAGLANLVLTHFSPRYQAAGGSGASIDDIRQEAAAAYRGRLWLARDLAHYRLARNGLLEAVAPPPG
ncbi:MBL fold metallo-hydrolase [Pseudomonas typographi]|uniref:Ribonuclease Z n=1 Tax=Pseudomonas typographi TaxID=2715964 RepID=A0ABR7Z0D4_9PSED|nr:MBL fold metallo-hydrolase [Pseudomonas typographi]